MLGITSARNWIAAPNQDQDEFSADVAIGQIMGQVTRFFREKTSHNPSAEMMNALADIPVTLVNILQGKAEEKYFVCPLDTGVGKTTTLAKSITSLRQHRNEVGGDFGVVMCVGRLTQIETLIQDMKLNDKEYAVLVADTEANRNLNAMGLGRENIDRAPVLLTTHAMIENRLVDGTAWADAADFYYRGKPRKVKVWDESILVRQPITLSRQDLHLAVAYLPGEPGNRIESLIDDVNNAKQGELLDVPDWAGDMTRHDVWAGLTDQGRKGLSLELVDRLLTTSGRRVRVSGGNEKKVIQYKARLPDDLAPVLVLDASARVREYYNQQNTADSNVSILNGQDVKKYERVTVHFEEGAAGRGSLMSGGKNYWATLDSLAKKIDENPERRVLVLHHKATRRADVERDLIKHLTARTGLMQSPRFPGIDPDKIRDRVKFCQWGQHNSTNEFSDCDLILTASLLFKGDAYDEAIGRAALNRDVSKELEDEIRQSTAKGELLHELLQGLSRGKLRNCEGDQALGCDIYIRAPRKAGLKNLLCTKLFPGSKLQDWGGKPVRVTASDRSGDLLEYVRNWQKNRADDGEALAVKTIYDDLEIDKSNASKIMKSEEVKRGLREMGLSIRNIPGMGRSKYIIPGSGEVQSAIGLTH